MENRPFVSIVIPTTGNVKFIKGLVESVNKLDYPKEKYELILIGDKETELLKVNSCLLYTSPSPRDVEESRMPSSA